jgi:hypothetical protein
LNDLIFLIPQEDLENALKRLPDRKKAKVIDELATVLNDNGWDWFNSQ